MTSIALTRPHSSADTGRAVLAFIAVAALLLSPLAAGVLPAAAVKYPAAWVLPISDWVGQQLTWLARTAAIGPVRVADITRAFAALTEIPVRALNILLNTGLLLGTGDQVHRAVPPLSWFTVTGLFTAAGYLLGGRRLAALCLFGPAYLVIFGLWPDSMATLASVIMATLTAAVLGLAIGTFAFRHPRALGAVEVAMNVMQTVPLFSYLVPTLLFLGYGPASALVATAIYALPPMVHATVLGLKSVPSEIIEFGHMAGATRRQVYWRIMIPSALRLLGTGLNQTIMASLNMVIIASMIGAGGLGYLVLLALRKLDIGAALQAGMAIVVLAVILDRLSQAMAGILATGGRLPLTRRRMAWAALGWLAVATLASFLLPALQDWPKDWTITTAPFWNRMISWINVHWFDALDAVRTFTLLHLMLPVKAYLLSLPWLSFVLVFGIAGLMLGGLRLAVITCLMLAFIAATGFWEPAVVSIYLVAIAVVISVLIGFPIGYLAARKPALQAPVTLALDTLQTLPTLVYLIPAVMLFRNGDFSAVLAIVSYAVAPAVRYALLGFSSLPEERLEAATISGATPWQILKWVRLPNAFPTLILGLNQTVMMSIAMLVITALVGTKDLGQQVFIALSRMKVGDGIIGGLAVAALALVADGLLKAWAKRHTPALNRGEQTGH